MLYLEFVKPWFLLKAIARLLKAIARRFSYKLKKEGHGGL